MTQPAIDHFPLERYERPGIYRRRIRVSSGPDWASAELEDDPHRYGVTLRHDGEHLIAIEGRALRTPWTACTVGAEGSNRPDPGIWLAKLAAKKRSLAPVS